MTRKLAFPAPSRASVSVGRGKFYTRAWTVEDVAEALEGGAWFVKGKHDFASREAARAAGVFGGDE